MRFDSALRYACVLLFKWHSLILDIIIGIALAKLIPLPSDVLDIATKVSHTLFETIAKRRQRSKASTLSRRRHLILSLKESLIQARDGSMQGSALASWLRKLQKEFVERMASIDADADGGFNNGHDDEEAEDEADEMNTDQRTPVPMEEESCSPTANQSVIGMINKDGIPSHQQQRQHEHPDDMPTTNDYTSSEGTFSDLLEV